MEGIKIIGFAFASDGDTRLMQAMGCQTFLKNPTDSPWLRFQADLRIPSVCFQDFVHLLVKFKCRLLKLSVILPLGSKYLASKGHQTELIDTVVKDQHRLSRCHLNGKDKMNFKTAELLFEQRVTDMLKVSVLESEGTGIFLDMEETFYSCADTVLQPLQRIEMLWN
ncbi:hypothetical protein FOCC_FOCC000806 [Frankliniella occidentalis]|nr:hypothetical protein FOCC_FOCC000806 [Frankliniella occidentalis]